MVNVGWGVCADSLYRQHERVGSDVFPTQGASRKPGHRATPGFLNQDSQRKERKAESFLIRGCRAGQGLFIVRRYILAAPTGTHRHPPAPTGTHRHPPAPTGTHRHPPAPTGTHRHPPAPTGTLRTATPPSPIVILAAAGIQSPDYAPTRSLQRQYVGNCGLALRTFPVSLTVITHKMGSGFPLRRELPWPRLGHLCV